LWAMHDQSRIYDWHWKFFTFLNQSTEMTHLLLIATDQGYTSRCVASWTAWDGAYVLIKHCVTCGSSKTPEVHSYFPITHIT
jgi:hypothetical protein